LWRHNGVACRGAGATPDAWAVRQALRQLLAPAPGCPPLLMPHPAGLPGPPPRAWGRAAPDQPPADSDSGRMADARAGGWTPLDGGSLFDRGDALAAAGAGGCDAAPRTDFDQPDGVVAVPGAAVDAWQRRWGAALQALLEQ